MPCSWKRPVAGYRGTRGWGGRRLAAAMAGAGFLGGLIMPSRDMLVRAAARVNEPSSQTATTARIWRSAIRC